jgi:integrase
MLLMLGENPKVVAERLGHPSISITMDTYSHVTPNMQQQAASKLADAMDNK